MVFRLVLNVVFQGEAKNQIRLYPRKSQRKWHTKYKRKMASYKCLKGCSYLPLYYCLVLLGILEYTQTKFFDDNTENQKNKAGKRFNLL